MTSRYRGALPQLDGGVFIMEGGMETDLVFNHGVALPGGATFSLLETEEGRAILRRFHRGYIDLARDRAVGYVMDSLTWRAHRDRMRPHGYDQPALDEVNRRSVRFMAELRDAAPDVVIVLSACIGPRRDPYASREWMSAAEAEDYHAHQLGVLAETDVNCASAYTMTHADEAVGIVRAARSAGLPIVVSFTTDTDGRLPNGATLGEAIERVDAETGSAPAYYLVNCAHPDHFVPALEDAAWMKRVRGLRANASKLGHAELNERDELDAGDPWELAADYIAPRDRHPHLHIFGACCGGDRRHVTAIAARLSAT